MKAICKKESNNTIHWSLKCVAYNCLIVFINYAFVLLNKNKSHLWFAILQFYPMRTLNKQKFCGCIFKLFFQTTYIFVVYGSFETKQNNNCSINFKKIVISMKY